MKKFLCLLTIALLTLTVPASAQVNGVFLGSDENGVNILNDKLRPGEEYLLPVLIALDGAPPVQLTAADIARNSLSVRVSTGSSAIASVKIEEKNNLVYLAVIPAGKGTVETLNATVRLNYRSKDSDQNVTVLPELKVGYSAMSEELLTTLDPGAFVELDNAHPIVSAPFWNDLAELNEHREVTLHGAGWRYTVNTTKLGKRNMVVDHEPVMDLVQRFPDYQLHFIGFPGEPDFQARGQLALDVSALAEEYNHDFYLYRCAYGKLYPLTYEYDRDAAELLLRPSQLSTYLISDRKISLSDNVPAEPDKLPAAPDSSAAPTPPVNNPPTGTTDGGWIAALVALVSLAGLGAMTVSKRR